MKILLLILLLIAGLTVFGIMAFQSIQDFLEERKNNKIKTKS